MSGNGQHPASPGGLFQKDLAGFGQRLQKVRERRRLRQNVLAARIGLRPFAISRYERGVALPRLPVLLALRWALQVSIDYLLVGDASGALRDLRIARHVPAINRLSADSVEKLDRILAAFLAGEEPRATP